MPWTEITRPDYDRSFLRYASDMTDDEWALIEPHLPPIKRLGRPRTVNLREVVNAILYIAASGCAWRYLPKDFPPFTTVQFYFYRWRDCRLMEKINNYLLFAVRAALGRTQQPSAGVIDVSPSKRRKAAGFAALTQARR